MYVCTCNDSYLIVPVYTDKIILNYKPIKSINSYQIYFQLLKNIVEILIVVHFYRHVVWLNNISKKNDILSKPSV